MPAMKAKQLFTGMIICIASILVYSCSKIEVTKKVDLIFEVEAENLHEGESVYITGNCPELGDWQPGAVLMEAATHDTWTISISVPESTQLEYKFTLGSWEREALNPDGDHQENFKFTAEYSKTVEHKINQWKSEGNPSEFVTGNVKYHLNIAGENIAKRHVIVWLPPDYENTDERYPVLYAHDGQNLFDPYTSYIGADWGIDEALTELIESDSCKPVIVVGMYNTGDRSDEYGLSQRGRDYQRFVVNTVKPMIDSTYRTKPDRENTAVMGSSMGGLVSFLLAWNYPDVFQQAACLSPAFLPTRLISSATLNPYPTASGFIWTMERSALRKNCRLCAMI